MNIKENKQNEEKPRLPVVERIYENPYTGSVIIRWKDGTTTKSKVAEGDEYDFNTGIAFCYMKKLTYDFDSFCDSLHTKKTYRTDKEGKILQQLETFQEEIKKLDKQKDSLEKRCSKLYKDLELVKNEKDAL